MGPLFFEGRQVGAVEFGKNINDDMVALAAKLKELVSKFKA